MADFNSKQMRSVFEDLSHTVESAERLYREYVKARDNGQSRERIAKDGWCGDLIDIFGDRYFEEEREYQRAMEEYRDSVLGTALTMHEWNESQSPQR